MSCSDSKNGEFQFGFSGLLKTGGVDSVQIKIKMKKNKKKKSLKSRATELSVLG